MNGLTPDSRKLRCHLHDVAFVTFPPVAGQWPTRGCPICVGAMRDHVRLERRRFSHPAGLEDRERLFDGLR